MPTGEIKITQIRYDVLEWIFKQSLEADGTWVKWQPKKFFGEENVPTNSEKSALSRTIADLEKADLIKRLKEQRVVRLTRYGEMAIYSYALEHKNEPTYAHTAAHIRIQFAIQTLGKLRGEVVLLLIEAFKTEFGLAHHEAVKNGQRMYIALTKLAMFDLQEAFDDEAEIYKSIKSVNK